MKTIIVALSLLLVSVSLQAEELVRAVSFAEEPLTVTAVPGEQHHLLLELPDPGITLPVYALKGMVRYDDVEGDGFLQLDSHFGDKGTFFSKSLAPVGPLGKLSGSSPSKCSPSRVSTGVRHSAKVVFACSPRAVNFTSSTGIEARKPSSILSGQLGNSRSNSSCMPDSPKPKTPRRRV